MKRLGETLLGLGAIDSRQLNSALALQRQWGMPLGRAVIQQRFCTSDQVLYALSLQTGVPSVNLDLQSLDASLATLVPRQLAERHKLVPLRNQGTKSEVLVVAMAAPVTPDKQEAVREISRRQQVVPVLASDEAIDRAIARLYGGGESLAALRDALELEIEEVEPPAPAKSPVLIYGWPLRAAKTLAAILATEGIPAKMVQTLEVLQAQPSDLIIAPLPALEQLMDAKARLSAQLVVAVKRQVDDAPRAAKVGARVVLEAPMDPRLLVRAVQAFREPTEAAAPTARA